MTEAQILMRWNNIPIARINNNYKVKILKKIRQSPGTKWYGHSAQQWIEAFDAKDNAEQKCYLDNIEAAMQLAQLRRRKEYENNRVTYRLLLGICRAANL